MRPPWWAIVAAKLALSRLPFGYALWQRLGLFRHGRMDVSDYAIKVFHDHMRRAGALKLAGKRVLELGPGDSIATALIAKAHGARAILVDSGRFMRTDVAPYAELQVALVREGLSCPSVDRCTSIEEILQSCEAQYLTAGLQSLRQLADDSVDVIFSQAVLEHVRKHEFFETMRECRRILKPGGICSHRVDLRDHLSGSLNNLRFAERTWESDLFARSGFYTNRLSLQRMLELFAAAGFEVDLVEVRRWSQLPLAKTRLAPEFRSIPDADLCVHGFDVLLR